jgi:hypothetical protein
MKSHKVLQEKPARSDKGCPQLMKRDDDLLLLIGEQTGYRFDQLQGLLARHPDTQPEDPSFLSESRTYALIQRWKKLGLVQYDKIYYHDPGWIWLTRRGLAHVHLSLRFLDLYHADLEHLFWINETRALIEDTYRSRPGFRWESERVIRATRERLHAQRKREPDLWIPFEYVGMHRPDALLRYRLSEEPDALEVVSALEVELSSKDPRTWKTIFLDLAQFYTHAHYYVAPEIKASFLRVLTRFQNEEPAFGELPLEQRMNIYVHDLEQML